MKQIKPGHIAQLIHLDNPSYAGQDSNILEILRDQSLSRGLINLNSLVGFKEREGLIFSNQGFANEFQRRMEEIWSLPNDQEKCEGLKKLCDDHKSAIAACHNYGRGDIEEDKRKITRVVPSVSAQSILSSTSDIEKTVSKIYDNLSQHLSVIPADSNVVVVSAEFHQAPATYVAQRSLLYIAKEQGFSHLVIENEPSIYGVMQRKLSANQTSSPFLLSVPDQTAGTSHSITNNSELLGLSTDNNNEYSLYRLAQDLGYTTHPGDLEDASGRGQAFFDNPIVDTMRPFIQERDKSIADCALALPGKTIIIAGADHAEGISKRIAQGGRSVQVLNLTTLAPHLQDVEEERAKLAEAGGDQRGIEEAQKLRQAYALREEKRRFISSSSCLRVDEGVDVNLLNHLLPDQIETMTREVHERHMQQHGYEMLESLAAASIEPRQSIPLEGAHNPTVHADINDVNLPAHSIEVKTSHEPVHPASLAVADIPISPRVELPLGAGVIVGQHNLHVAVEGGGLLNNIHPEPTPHTPASPTETTALLGDNEKDNKKVCCTLL